MPKTETTRAADATLSVPCSKDFLHRLRLRCMQQQPPRLVKDYVVEVLEAAIAGRIATAEPAGKGRRS